MLSILYVESNVMSLEQLIRQYVRLSQPNKKGWCACVHAGCDHGNKGPRAAFIFNGEITTFNCFNCGTGITYNPEIETTLPDKMAEILTDFGIQKNEWEKVVFHHFLEHAQNGPKHTKRLEQQSMEPDLVPLPAFFYLLQDDPNDELSQHAIAYLVEERRVDPLGYPFLLSRLTNDPESVKWYGRLIIPIFKNDELIFWQGRDLTGKAQKKYLSVNVPRENVLHGFEYLFTDIESPLYITEGWFDAYHVNGVAVFGSKMTANQIKWLNQSPRMKVVIPDRLGDGHLLAEQAISLGWSVAIPDCGQNIKDVNDCVNKYGLVYTLRTLKENTLSGFEAEMRVKLYCETSNKTKSKNNNNRSSKKTSV